MIFLASASPRRQEILKTAGFDFEICPMDIDEDSITGKDKEELVMNLAKAKAIACRDFLATSGKISDSDIIVGSDTLVFADGKPLGKPADKKQWEEYIRLLQGKDHEVITGVALIKAEHIKTFYSTTTVSVSNMTDKEIHQFIARNEDMDKAGGYAIQGYFSQYINKISGEYNNVVGFPIAKFRQEVQLDPFS